MLLYDVTLSFCVASDLLQDPGAWRKSLRRRGEQPAKKPAASAGVSSPPAVSEDDGEAIQPRGRSTAASRPSKPRKAMRCTWDYLPYM